MAGRPVWLASISFWRTSHKGQEPILTGSYTPGLLARGGKRLERLLHGVGDETRERLFRMNLTLCRHRALTDEEAAGLSDEWRCARPVHLAGGPVEVLWQTGIEETPSCQPCENPRKRWVSSAVWLPIDCGGCLPCRARSRIEDDVVAGIYG